MRFGMLNMFFFCVHGKRDGQTDKHGAFRRAGRNRDQQTEEGRKKKIDSIIHTPYIIILKECCFPADQP